MTREQPFYRQRIFAERIAEGFVPTRSRRTARSELGQAIDAAREQRHAAPRRAAPVATPRRRSSTSPFALAPPTSTGYVADRLKRSLLDAIGCALAALDAEPVRAIRWLVDELGGTGSATIIGGGRTSPGRAALVNGCLVRDVDFMNSIASAGEVCHPTDNIAALLAAGERAVASGKQLLLAMPGRRRREYARCAIGCRPVELWSSLGNAEETPI